LDYKTAGEKDMPKGDTWSFASREQLVAELRKGDWKKDLRELHLKNPDLGPLTAIYDSVDSSTYRSFRKHKDWQPSVIFRGWTSTELFHGGLKELAGVGSHDQYHAWAVRLARSLAGEWEKRMRYTLHIPRALKLINLLAKGLCVVSPLWPETSEKLVWHIEVPLDMYSLRPLSCLPELAELGIRWVDASMGSVKDLKTYRKIQETIFRFCETAGVPPLAYDFLAWNNPHKD
jgi:hypothetical protein